MPYSNLLYSNLLGKLTQRRSEPDSLLSMDVPHQPHQPDTPAERGVPESEILSESIYGSFERMLTPEQVTELYAMCLDDADRRVRLLQQAAAAQDQENFRVVMHAIKGTCGMVGALELAAMATTLEQEPMPKADDPAAYEEFLCASAHLRRILKGKSIQPPAGD